jgi:hypothetical protein
MSANPLDLGQFVKIRNGTDKAIKGRHGGEEYVFPVGETKVVRYETACHIFGLDQEDKTPALARLGWARSSDEIEAGLERLHKISFDELSLETSSDARPFVNAGDKAAAEGQPSAAAESLDPEAGDVDL